MPPTQVLADLTDVESSLTAPRFDCVLRHGGFDAAWLHAEGELDLETAPMLETALRRADSWPRVVLDLRQLACIDSSGVSVIIKASVRATRAGRRLVLVRGPAKVDRFLRLTGAAAGLEVVDLQAVQPPVQALVELAHRSCAV